MVPDILSSHLEEMNKILAQSTSIKHLDLGLGNMNNIHRMKDARNNETKAITHLLKIEEPFETLLSLEIPADYCHAYRSSASHRIVTSLLLSRIHEWKSVEQLHLRGLHATYAIQNLVDRTPNLRRLDLTFSSNWWVRGELDPALIANFIDSLERLEDLKIRDLSQAAADVVWPAIVKQKHHLRKLDLFSTMGWGTEAPIWGEEHLDEVCCVCPLYPSLTGIKCNFQPFACHLLVF